MIPKKLYRVEIFYLPFCINFSEDIILQAHSYSHQTCAPMFLRLALTASERYTE